GGHAGRVRSDRRSGVHPVPVLGVGHRVEHGHGGRDRPAERGWAGSALRRTGGAGRGREPGGDSMIAVVGLVIGVVAGMVLHPTVPVALQPYLPIAVVAALDALFGGLRAKLDGLFDDKVFVVSFLSNVLVAAFIVFLGDQLGVGSQLSTGVIVVLGIRIFTNLAAIRRGLLKA